MYKAGIFPQITNMLSEQIKSSFNVHKGFVIYSPSNYNKEKGFFYDQNALEILLRSSQFSTQKISFNTLLSAYCIKWKDFIENKSIKKRKINENNFFRNILKSDRRFYYISGIKLSNDNSIQKMNKVVYLFIFERIKPDNINFPLISRLFKLNKREQEIIKLLTNEKSNKEIASILGLSPNTIKSYLKILMRKLSVSSRLGIITCLLIKNNKLSY